MHADSAFKQLCSAPFEKEAARGDSSKLGERMVREEEMFVGATGRRPYPVVNVCF